MGFFRSECSKFGALFPKVRRSFSDGVDKGDRLIVNPATPGTARHMVVELLIRFPVEMTQVGSFGGLAWIWRALRIHDISLRYGRDRTLPGCVLEPLPHCFLIGTQDRFVEAIPTGPKQAGRVPLQRPSYGRKVNGGSSARGDDGDVTSRRDFQRVTSCPRISSIGPDLLHSFRDFLALFETH